MSMLQSISAASSSSTSTMTTLPPNDLPVDSSNVLYEDRDHFQNIFSNDSRFFDTSLHLYKSYLARGYIPSENVDYKSHNVSSLTATSNGHKHRWRARLLGFGSKQDHDHNPASLLKAFLTPTLMKRHDRSNSMRSGSLFAPAEPVVERQKNPPLIVQYQRQAAPTVNITDEDLSDESEVTITKL